MKLAEYNTVYDIKMESEHFCFECHNEYYFNDEGGEDFIGLMYNEDLNTYLQFDKETKDSSGRRLFIKNDQKLETIGSSGERLMICHYCIEFFLNNYTDKILPPQLILDDLTEDTHYIYIKDTGYGD